MSIKKLPPPILDVMLDGRHMAQVPFLLRQRHEVIDGETIDYFDYSEMNKYIESQCPDVRGYDFRIYETNKIIQEL